MKFIIFFSFLAFTTKLTVSEPPPQTLPLPYQRLSLELPVAPQGSEGSKILNEDLLSRIADLLSQDGDGSERSVQDQENESEGSSIVDSDLLDRIARIIQQNEGQNPLGRSGVPENEPLPANFRLPLDAYGPPSFQTAGSTPPEPAYGVPQIMRIAGAITLDKPQLARRIASFHYQEDQGDNSVGSSYGVPSSSSPYTSDSYTSSLPSRTGGNSRFQFINEPQPAERIAAFEIPDAVPQVQGYPQLNARASSYQK